MCMMLKPRCNRRSGWGKSLLWGGKKKKKKHTHTHSVLLVVFFDWKGIIHHEFVPGGQMVNKQLYQEVLARLGDVVRRKRPEFWENQTWTLHHDNDPAHASLLICSYVAKHQTSVVPHPPNSPDLAQAEFFLFLKHKNTLKGRRFQTIEDIQENAKRELRAITESAFQEAFQQWKNRWERCVASKGDYVEEDSV